MIATLPRTESAETPTSSRSGGGLSVAEAASRIEALRGKIRDTEEDFERGGRDGAGDGTSTGHLEEWASAAFDGDQPPAGVLWARVAAAEAAGQTAGSGRGAGRKLIAWIGDWCWLHPRGVGATPENWLWLKTRRQVDRVWAIELCCRNPAVSVVVADGRGLPMAATRRLQLAARAGGVRVLLARTPEELCLPSAAPVRGTVDGWAGEEPEEEDFWPRRLHADNDNDGDDPLAARAVAEPAPPAYAPPSNPPPPRTASPPRWTARLLRRKGLRPTDAHAPSVPSSPEPDLFLSGEDGSEAGGWVVEKRHGSMVVRAPDRLADRPAPAEARRAG